MLNRSTLLMTSTLLASSALAHGPQVQISLDDANKVVVRQIVTTSSSESFLPRFATLTPPTSVHVLPVFVVNNPTNAFNGQVTVQPHPFSQPGGHSGGGGYSFRYNFYTPDTNMFINDAPVGKVNLEGTNFRMQYTSGLTRWDGSSFIDAGDTQLKAQRGSDGNKNNPLQIMTSQDDGPASSFINFGTLNAPTGSAVLSQNPHGYITHSLVGDGVNPTSPVLDGIYKISLQISSTHSDIAASDTFDWVLFKGVSVSEAADVAEMLGGSQQVIPEPASLIALATLGGLLLRSRPSRLV